MRIGVLGCGNVGAAFVELVTEQAKTIEARTGVALEVTRVAVRNLSRQRDVEIDPALLTRHADETGSTLASDLLASGDLSDFVKVLPRDYAAVLETRRQAVDEGLDPDGDIVWNRIMEVTGG